MGVGVVVWLGGVVVGGMGHYQEGSWSDAPLSTHTRSHLTLNILTLVITLRSWSDGSRSNLFDFEYKELQDGWHLEGDMSSFLSVRYLNYTETGEITADQEAYIDTCSLNTI